MRICAWCGVKLGRWRTITFRSHCRRCAIRFEDCGIYLQCGGPPCPYMSRLPKVDVVK